MPAMKTATTPTPARHRQPAPAAWPRRRPPAGAPPRSFAERPPPEYAALERATIARGFGPTSDAATGALLRTLAASKPGGCFLEIGTGTGMATSWLLDGMDRASYLLTVDHDQAVLSFAAEQLGHHARRVEFHCEDGAAFLRSLAGEQFDLVFADAIPGKFTALEEALDLVRPGGTWAVDHMLPQPWWSPGHQERLEALLEALEARDDFALSRLDFSTGLLLATRLHRASV